MRCDPAAPARGQTLVVWGSLLVGAITLVAIFTLGTLLVGQASGANQPAAEPAEPVKPAEPRAEPAIEQAAHRPAEAETSLALRDAPAGAPDAPTPPPSATAADRAAEAPAPPASAEVSPEADTSSAASAPTFDNRRLEKDRTLSMRVTAYSPHAESCGEWADGYTASGYSVWTNGMRLVAADTDLLPFGTIVSVPGYNGGRPVQVLDRGGAIKGHRLDVLFGTHERALEWGVQNLEITVWRYADE